MPGSSVYRNLCTRSIKALYNNYASNRRKSLRKILKNIQICFTVNSHLAHAILMPWPAAWKEWRETLNLTYTSEDDKHGQISRFFSISRSFFLKGLKGPMSTNTCNYLSIRVGVGVHSSAPGVRHRSIIHFGSASASKLFLPPPSPSSVRFFLSLFTSPSEPTSRNPRAFPSFPTFLTSISHSLAHTLSFFFVFHRFSQSS